MNLDDLASKLAAKLKEAINEIEEEEDPMPASRSSMTETEIRLDNEYDDLVDASRDDLVEKIKALQAFKDEAHDKLKALHARLYDEIARRHGYASIDAAHECGAKFSITEDQKVDLFLSTPAPQKSASQKSASAAPSKN